MILNIYNLTTSGTLCSGGSNKNNKNSNSKSLYDVSDVSSTKYFIKYLSTLYN